MMAVAVVSALVVGGAALSPQHEVEDASPVGEAEAVAPLVVAAAGVAGTAIVASSGQYVYEEYFSGAEDVEQATDETLREAVHDEAIISQGTNTGFLDNVDNDINTIEGSLEQKLGQASIAQGDSIKSESEAVSLAENTSSDYLWTTQQNLVETHNYHALSVLTYMDKLDSVDASDDYGATQYVTVESEEDLQEAFDTSTAGEEYSIQSNTVMFLQTDLTISTSESNAFATKAPVKVIGNGHTISTDARNVSNFRGGNFHLSNVSVDGNIIINEYGGNVVNGSSVSAIDDDAHGTDMYVDDSSTVSGTAYNAVSSPVDVSVISNGYTMDPTDVGDVPTVTVGDSDKEITAVKVNVDPAYSQSSDNTVKVAVPYKVSDSTPLTDSEMDLAIQTPSSGVQNYAVPVDFQRAHDLVTQRDNLSAETYSISSQWATDLWNNTLSSVASDDSKSVTDVEGVYDELGTYTVSADPDNPATVLSMYTGTYETVVDPANTRMTVTDSNGTHENVVLFSTDMKALTSQTSDASVVAVDDTFDVSQSTQSNSESFTGVAQNDTVELSNGKIDSITSATDSGGTDVSSNVTIVDREAGVIQYTGSSTIDLSVSYDYTQGASRTFAIDPSTGERVSLSGSVTVDSISQGDKSDVSSVEIRTFDTTETNLSNIADRLDSQYNVTIEVADHSGGGGFSFPDLGGETGIIIVVLAGGALVLLGRS
ncbi:hypothetical protein [Halobacterium salinarum]|uniref:hypothetical protein n=1 Tax=Halobacterium salinarum TaxID=2242 RepID=UPI002557197A|nr:hypothetical protein [Halobacterium salinarum]